MEIPLAERRNGDNTCIGEKTKELGTPQTRALGVAAGWHAANLQRCKTKTRRRTRLTVSSSLDWRKKICTPVSASGPSHADSPRVFRSDRLPPTAPKKSPHFEKDRSPDAFRQSRGFVAGQSALRRTLGAALARRGALRRGSGASFKPRRIHMAFAIATGSCARSTRTCLTTASSRSRSPPTCSMRRTARTIWRRWDSLRSGRFITATAKCSTNSMIAWTPCRAVFSGSPSRARAATITSSIPFPRKITTR